MIGKKGRHGRRGEVEVVEGEGWMGTMRREEFLGSMLYAFEVSM